MPCTIFMAVSYLLYAMTIGFGYVLDDQMVIWDNIYVQKGIAGLGDIFASDSFTGFFKGEKKMLLEGGRYRPLSLATFAVEVSLFGKDKPGVGHFINILGYGLNVVLLYRVLLGLFPTASRGRWFFSLAFVAGLFFVLHPLHSEVVANIKGRDEIMSLTFSLAAWYAVLKHFDTARRRWLFAAGAFFLLGLLSKENTLTFLAVVPLSLWLFSDLSFSKILKGIAPLLVASILFIIIRLKALGYVLDHGKAMNDLMNDPFLGMTSGERLATIFLTFGWYLKLLVAPYPLTHDYYPYHVPKVDWSEIKSVASLIFYAAMAGVAVWRVAVARKNSSDIAASKNWDWSVVAFSILYFLATFSIVSNLFVGVGTFMNERFLYMPSVGFCLLAAWFLTRKLPALLGEDSDKPYILGAGAAVLVAAASAFIIIKRLPDWQDGYSLNAAAVKTSPGSARAHSFYATALYKDKYQAIRSDKSKKEEVKAMSDEMTYHVDKALQINPNYSAALTMKAAIAAVQFEQDKQLDRLFNDWEYVLDKVPYNASVRDFIGQYMNYLSKSGANPHKMASFCHRRGYEFYWKQRRDGKAALEFLNYALNQQTEDKRVLEDLSEVYQAMGNAAKAAEMQARAAATTN